MRPHRHHLMAAGAAAGLATVLAACSSGATPSTTANAGSSGATSGASATGGSGGTTTATVKLANEPGVGEVLVNSAGQTLYLFAPDKQQKPTCSGSCAATWPPLTVTGTPVAGSGVDEKLLGTVQGAGGQRQVTYDHWPLYTYVADTAPGDARGEGITSFGGKWWAVDSSGKKATESGTSGSTSSSTTYGSGYGY